MSIVVRFEMALYKTVSLLLQKRLIIVIISKSQHDLRALNATKLPSACILD